MMTATDPATSGRAKDPRHAQLSAGRAKASVKGAFWSVLNTGFGTILTALVFYIASRFLTPYDFGVVALSVSIVSIALSVAPTAFGEALIQRKDIDATHLDTVFWMCMTAAVVLYLPIFLLAPTVAAWLDEPVLTALLPFVGLRLFFDMLMPVPYALIVRKMRFRVIAIRTAIANGAAAVVCIVLLLQGYGYWALALSQMTTAVVAAVVMLVSAGWRPGLSPRLSAFRDLAPYGIFAAGSHMMNVLRMDGLLIGAMGGAVFAGLFNFASRLFQMLTSLVSGALASVSHSLFSSLQSERDKAREAFLLAVYASALVAFPLFAGLLVVADRAIPLVFGPQWADAVIAVQALSVAGMLASISVVQASLINGHGKAKWWFLYQLTRQVTNVIVIVIALPYGFGVMMVALTAKTVLLWPVSVVMTMRLIGIGAADYARTFMVPGLVSLAMVLLVLVLPRMFADLGPAALLTVQIMVGGVFYTLVAGALSASRLKRVLVLLGSRKKVRME